MRERLGLDEVPFFTPLPQASPVSTKENSRDSERRGRRGRRRRLCEAEEELALPDEGQTKTKPRDWPSECLEQQTDDSDDEGEGADSAGASFSCALHEDLSRVLRAMQVKHFNSTKAGEASRFFARAFFALFATLLPSPSWLSSLSATLLLQVP